MHALALYFLSSPESLLVPLLKRSSSAISFQDILFEKYNNEPPKLLSMCSMMYKSARSMYSRPPRPDDVLPDVARGRPTFTKRVQLMESAVLLVAYRARHHWLHFLAPIWNWCASQTKFYLSKEILTDAESLIRSSTENVKAYLLNGSSILDHLQMLDVIGDERGPDYARVTHQVFLTVQRLRLLPAIVLGIVSVHKFEFI